MTELDSRLASLIQCWKYPFVFVTISGAHLYGFPSPDSDYDLRGVHILPPDELLGLDLGPETLEVNRKMRGLEGDIVSHDAKKFFSLLLKRNGYVLEQLTSPLKLKTSPEHDELIGLLPSLVTSHHSHHYLGFAKTQWNLFDKAKNRRLKPLLYTLRVLLSGIYLMRTGKIEANLLNLNDEFKLPYIQNLVAAKTLGNEKEPFAAGDPAFFGKEYKRLELELKKAAEKTSLPTEPSGKPMLHDLLLRLRRKAGEAIRNDGD